MNRTKTLTSSRRVFIAFGSLLIAGNGQVIQPSGGASFVITVRGTLGVAFSGSYLAFERHGRSKEYDHRHDRRAAYGIPGSGIERNS